MIDTYKIFEKLHLGTNPLNVQRVEIRVSDKIAVVFNPVETLKVNFMDVKACMN